ncbi:MAG: hypothetical protein K2M94_08500 [Paramuribaculum sp.]|nr:hypothetical protein [Paramuribaculum sp.]
MNLLRLCAIFIPLVTCLPVAFAQVEYDFDSQQEVRENPVIEGAEEDEDIEVPSFINMSKNHIMMNGADWNKLYIALNKSTKIPVSIVHIGDSHLQADIATAQVRNFLQYDYGDAGRGLIVPWKMNGTNEPRDYAITSRKPWSYVKLMSGDWKRTMGFTGSSISPATRMSEISFSTSEKDDYNPFSAITIFHKGQFFVTGITDARGALIPYKATPSQDYTHIEFLNDVTNITVMFESAGDLTVFGANLIGNRPGIFYHVIGNNGATYDTYNRIGNVGVGISPLQPSLIIVSLGTNDAFGKFNSRNFTNSLNSFITNLRQANPDAAILLVTPSECQRVKYTKVPGKRRKGKRRSPSTRRVAGYTINPDILEVRNAIMEYGKEHHIPVYDWYEVAGGTNSSSKWIDDGLFGKDRVHYTYKGYNLHGYLLYQALHETFESKDTE